MIDIPQDVLTDVVGRTLGGVRVALGSWSVDSIAYPSVSPHSRGLFRVRGSADTPSGAREWSLILKAIQLVDDSPMSEETHPFYWKREALAYQSGLLPQRPDGLAAPTCFGVTERSDASVWLWLEAIDEPSTAPRPSRDLRVLLPISACLAQRIVRRLPCLRHHG
jgi:hypothetical protein